MRGGKKMEKARMLIIDDRPEYLELAQQAVEAIMTTGKMKGYDVEYSGNFEEALEKVREGSYNEVVTDLFEGEDKPKGLRVALECLDRGIKVGILTDGNRHYDALGGLRYYLEREGRPSRDVEYEIERIGAEAQKLGIMPDEMEKRGISFWADLLIGENGTDKRKIENWRRSLKTFLGIPYLTDLEADREITLLARRTNEEIISWMWEVRTFIYDVKHTDTFKVGYLEASNRESQQYKRFLYLVEKESSEEIKAREILSLETKGFLRVKEAREENEEIVVIYEHQKKEEVIKARK